MALVKGRILRAEGHAANVSAHPVSVKPETRDRILRQEVEAVAAAARIIGEAHARAEAELTLAKQKAADAVAVATREAEEREQAKLAAAYLVMRSREESRADGDLDRAVGLAVVLAERLIGASLAIAPGQVATLAREALSEAKGTRRARIEAHPLDADALLSHIASIAAPEISVTVVVNADLARGSLILHTDLGILDAKLAPRLERLATALKGALR